MNKTINATIGGLVFSLEEAGYEKLHNYLESLKSHFSGKSYGPEVISDIESRIAEQFNTKNTGNAQRAITVADVEEVLKSIGSPEEIDGTEKTENTDTGTVKRLYRSSDDVMIAGVASGIALYFGIDAILVRALFVIITLAGGWGVPLYIILWMVTPEAKTAGQKLEMKGAPATIKQMEQTAKEKINELRSSGFPRRFLNFIATIIRYFIHFVLGTIGLAVTFAATVAGIAVTFSLANLLFNRNSPYVDFPLSSISRW
jgi:phage shock protein PspC (stress-responsive transcriptional regulator)